MTSPTNPPVPSVTPAQEETRSNVLASSTKGRTKLFTLWLLKRIIFPLLPILILGMAEYFLELGNSVLANDKILVFAFLFLVIYLQEAKTNTARLLLYVASVAPLLLYTFAIIAAAYRRDLLDKIYMAGSLFALIEVLMAIVLKLLSRDFDGGSARE